jgi:phage gp36-like protein
MAYCTLTDLLDQIEESGLIRLTDDENLGAVDTARVDKAIADADAEINGYCGSRYRVPLDPVPDLLRKFSVDIAIYNLIGRRDVVVPDDRRARYKDAISFLRHVAAGTAQLGVADPDGTPAPAERPRITGPKRVFSRDSLEGW